MTPRRVVCVLAIIGWGSASCAHHHSPLAPTSLRVTGITPLTGSSFGGTGVTIHGDGFEAGVTVTIGGAPATNVAVLDAQTMTAMTPVHATGPAAVAVALHDRSVGLTNAFTFGAPVVGDNPPPVIQSISSTGPHPNQPSRYVEISEPLTLSAVATDSETAPEALQYTWSAPAGTFLGTGPTQTWQPPADATVPQAVSLLLTVTEHNLVPDSRGLPVDRPNVVTATFDVWLHDAKSEVGAMGKDFLELFSNSNLSPTMVLHNFLPGCLDESMGESELPDVIANRQMFTILSHTIQDPTFTLNFGGVCTMLDASRDRPGDACAYYQSHWVSRSNFDGSVGTSDGIDQVSAFYRDNHWALCQSEFFGFPTSTRNVMIR